MKMWRSMPCRSGDQLRVRPGEKIPVDGEVIEGQHRWMNPCSPANRAVEKTAGAKVTGGTLNTTAAVMRAERVGSETMLAQIVKLVGAGAAQSRADPGAGGQGGGVVCARRAGGRRA
jgi:P-type Cu+ transporter